MPNVMFKRGTQSALDALASSSIVDGSFYLTTDTNRLYIGKNDNGTNKLEELNQSITVVNNFTDLPQSTSDDTRTIKGSRVAVGQFYYINSGAETTTGNVLAVCSSINKDTNKINWTQVNPDTDTNDNTFVSGMTVTKGTVTAGQPISYTITLNQTKSSKNATDVAGPTQTATFSINPEDVTSLAGVGVEVKSSSVTNNQVTISTAGGGAAATNAGFTLKGGNNITLSGDSSTLTIAARNSTYTLNTNDSGNIILKEVNGADAATVTLSAGTNLDLSVSENTFTFNHATSGVSAASYGPTANATLTQTSAFTVPQFTVDAQGHITAAASRKYTLNIPNIYPTSLSAKANGGLTIGLQDATDVSADSILYHTITVDGSSTTVYNQGDLGSFYSASEIDNKLKGVNAMVYRGTLGNVTGAEGTSIPNSNVQIGDTYLIADNSIAGYKKGDLVIATGTEDDNGYITSSTLKWTRVEGNEAGDTTYTFSVANNVVKYKASTASEATLVQINGGSLITASTSGKIITLNHDKLATTPSVSAAGNSATTTTELNPSDTFVIPYVAIDDYGHVTGLANHTVKLPSDNNSTYELQVATPTTSPALLLKGTNGTDSKVSFTSGTTPAISVSATTGTNAKITVSHATQFANAITVNSSSAVSLVPGASFTVPYVSVDVYGHVTALGAQVHTLPSYSIKGGTTANKPQIVLASSNTTDQTIDLKSDSLDISSTASTINIDLNWGTF